MNTPTPCKMPQALDRFLNEARAAGRYVYVQHGTQTIFAKVDDCHDTLSERYPAVHLFWDRVHGFSFPGYIAIRREGLTTYGRGHTIADARKRVRLS